MSTVLTLTPRAWASQRMRSVMGLGRRKVRRFTGYSLRNNFAG